MMEIQSRLSRLSWSLVSPGLGVQFFWIMVMYVLMFSVAKHGDGYVTLSTSISLMLVSCVLGSSIMYALFTVLIHYKAKSVCKRRNMKYQLVELELNLFNVKFLLSKRIKLQIYHENGVSVMWCNRGSFLYMI